MKTYARIVDGVVAEIFTTANDITKLFHATIVWIDVTSVSPAPHEGWLYDGSVFTAPTSPSPNPEVIFTQIINAGLAVVSTGTPALNGTYEIDDIQQQRISGIAAGIATRNRLPGGGSTFDYPDVTGTSHAFTQTQFLNFASAIEDYIYALSRGSSPTTPVTIA